MLSRRYSWCRFAAQPLGLAEQISIAWPDPYPLQNDDGLWLEWEPIFCRTTPQRLARWESRHPRVSLFEFGLRWTVRWKRRRRQVTNRKSTASWREISWASSPTCPWSYCAMRRWFQLCPSKLCDTWTGVSSNFCLLNRHYSPRSEAHISVRPANSSSLRADSCLIFFTTFRAWGERRVACHVGINALLAKGKRFQARDK